MGRRKQLRKYIQRAKTSLSLEKITPIAQYGLFFALLASASLVLISRLFVWPYYRQTAIDRDICDNCLHVVEACKRARSNACS